MRRSRGSKRAASGNSPPEPVVVKGGELWCGDCVEVMGRMEPESVDLVFGSPPYMDARTYGIDAVYDCEEWVEWMLKVSEAAIRISKGLVLWVVAGVQRKNCYWPGCEGLMWEWWKRGNHLWRPCVWWKVDSNEGGTGIPGSGGKQWLRADWEYVLAFKKEGPLPWADNTVMGHEPVYKQVGGEMSNRTVDGRRANDRVGEGVKSKRKTWNDPGSTRRDNGVYKEVKRDMPPGPVHDADGNLVRTKGRPFPKLANPGNCIIVKARVGGGHMGSKKCHEGEAPFPEQLAKFFVKSFCPPGGKVLDPFVGSGTTPAVAVKEGRKFVGIDLRDSQIELTLRRLREARRQVGFGS